MNYRKIAPSELPIDFMPQMLRPLLGLDDEFIKVYAAFHDDYFIGGVFFTVSKGEKSIAIMQYIEINSAYRMQGIGKSLLSYAEEQLKEEFLYFVGAKCSGHNTLMEKTHFLIRCGYDLLNSQNRLILYRLPDLMESVFASHLSGLQKLMDKVKFIDELDPLDWDYFKEKVAEKGYTYDLEKSDPLFSGVLVDNKQIIGYMNLEEKVENVLFLSGIYLDEKADIKFSLPAMIGKALQLSGQLLPKETLVLMNLNAQKEYNGMITLFGEGIVNIPVHEFFKEL